ncbi:MAG: hypothetical protein IJS15_04015 [Victivallales bacterium]|nr:hypothetical protein [Victivallales bacterium]
MKRLFYILWMCALGAVSVAQNGDAPAGWSTLLQCRKQEGNLRFVTPWGGRTRPVVFMLRQKSSGRMVRLQMDANSFSAEEMLRDGRIATLPPVSVYPSDSQIDARNVEIVFKVREDEWSYYVDGVLAGTMAAPFDLPGDVLWPKRPGVKLVSPMRYLPVPRAAFKTDFMIEPGAPNELYPWLIQLGAWHIHTAQQQAVIRPETDQRRAKEAPLTADKSPNFYSLKGGGENKDSIITMGYDFYDNYSLSGSLQLDNGEAGIVFLHRDEAVPPSAEGEEQKAPDPANADFYALTIRMETPYPGNRDIRLWKQCKGRRTVMARASVPLYNTQWYLPGIKLHGDEIICLLDEAELFRVKDQLPPGGKVGLFANTKEQIRFDDVTLAPYRTFDLAEMDGIRHNAMHHTSGFFQDGKKRVKTEKLAGFRLYRVDEELKFDVKAGKEDEMLVLGRAFSKNMYFKATVLPQENEAVGLVAGWSGKAKPYYLFSVVRADGKDNCSVAKISPNGEANVLDAYSVPSGDEAVELGVDATEPGKLRCFRNGLLLHYIECDGPVTGGSGVWLGANGSATVKGLALSGTREVVLEQEQKNPVFKTDSFMRHWAAPEGQWINGGGDILWHKGDFFGDFSIRLPVVPTAELHVGVPDGKTEGAIVVSVAADKISLSTKVRGSDAPVVQEAPLAPIGDKAVADQSYELRHEGSWLWLLVEGRIVLRQRLDYRIKEFGTRVLSRKMTLAHMAKSKVTRANVLDEYFNESPHAWLANGGDWQIINRFQCTPSWSHMIGEAPTGLGAFWLKKLFKGDMTLEFYAGTRHNYYDMAGNLNCTIMAKDTTPSQGYTVACTEWDQNDSQNWTTFYRNGVPLAKTDSYLVPRKRKGMYRRILNPLVSQGRPIHGAWFYIKLRKIGDKLEYHFDDELLFTQKDDEMMNEGMVGIWTFIHSMTLAQIKITFDSIAPRPIPVTFLPNEDAEPAKPAEVAWSAKANGFPLDAADSRHWGYSDSVNQGHLISAPGAVGLVSELGGGEMKLIAKLPAVKLTEIAGWRFKIKRTRRAEFNFFYHIGELGENGAFKGTVNCFHRITGDAFDEGAWSMTGSSRTGFVEKIDIASEDGWEDVTVWIPIGYLRRMYGFADDAKAGVEIGGFGIEQRDAISNGITGNGPGEGYAIKELRPILIGAPKLTQDAESQTALADGEFTADAAALAAQLESAGAKVVNELAIRERRGNDVLRNTLTWIKLPEKPEYELKWDASRFDTIYIDTPADYIDNRTGLMQVQCAGETLVPEIVVQEPLAGGKESSRQWGMTLRLPRKAEAAAQVASGKLEFSVKCGDDTRVVTLDANAKERRNRGPVLMNIEGLTPFCLTYESGFRAPLSGSPDKRLRDGHGDELQSEYLSVHNNKYGQGLMHTYNVPFSIANYPVAQFRYRAYDMDHVTMYFSNGQATRLSNEDLGRAVNVRLGTMLKLDEKWNTWTGVVSDSFVSSDYNVNRFLPGSVKIGSFGSPDQTGAHSRLDLDDFTFGPAVRSAEQLQFVPKYYDADGVATIRVALLPGAASAYDSKQETLDALEWKDYKPDEKVLPVITDAFPAGVSHIVMAAVDGKGNRSSYFDVPFYFDRTQPTVSASITPTNDPRMNGTQLNVVFKSNGESPLAMEKAKFFFNGKERALSSWTNMFTHSQGNDSLVLNYPLIYRDALDDAKDGDEMTFEADNIIDGAGNTQDRFKFAFKVDYAGDKEGPAWYECNFGSSVNYMYNWDGHRQNQEFSQGQHNGISVSHSKGASPYLVNSSYYSTGDLSRTVNWSIARFPCVSFRATTTTARASAAIHLVLTATNGKVYTISLIKPGSQATELNRTESFAWTNGVWLHFSFNVKELMLKAGIPQADVDATTVKSINFQRRGLKHADTLLLDDFFIHGMPDAGKPDVLAWHAFDASGVASLEATCVSFATADGKVTSKDEWAHSFTAKHSADLNELRAKFKGVRWFRCQAKDKAGKLSVPFWLPVYSE